MLKVFIIKLFLSLKFVLNFNYIDFFIPIDFSFILIIRKSGFFIMIVLYFSLSCKTYVFTTFFIN